jgi:hypothetical protein
MLPGDTNERWIGCRHGFIQRTSVGGAGAELEWKRQVEHINHQTSAASRNHIARKRIAKHRQQCACARISTCLTEDESLSGVHPNG